MEIRQGTVQEWDFYSCSVDGQSPLALCYSDSLKQRVNYPGYDLKAKEALKSIWVTNTQSTVPGIVKQLKLWCCVGYGTIAHRVCELSPHCCMKELLSFASLGATKRSFRNAMSESPGSSAGLIFPSSKSKKRPSF